jgi:ribosomal protein S18 acetylase RimI-like enzyme
LGEHRGKSNVVRIVTPGREGRDARSSSARATNERAIRLWQSFGFAVVGRIPGAFRHPTHGFVDALVMHRTL